MNILEKDLEEIIFEADRDFLREKCGLLIIGKLFRQVRIGSYGVADMISFERTFSKIGDPFININVYELKKEKVGISAFLQAIGYAKGIDRYLKKRKFSFEVNIRIVLIGSRIDDLSTFCYLSDLIPMDKYHEQFLEVYSFSFDASGLNFKLESDYSLKEEDL